MSDHTDSINLLRELAFGYDRDLPFDAKTAQAGEGGGVSVERFEITSRYDERISGLLIQSQDAEGPRPLILVGHPRHAGQVQRLCALAGRAMGPTRRNLRHHRPGRTRRASQTAGLDGGLPALANASPRSVVANRRRPGCEPSITSRNAPKSTPTASASSVFPWAECAERRSWDWMSASRPRLSASPARAPCPVAAAVPANWPTPSLIRVPTRR